MREQIEGLPGWRVSGTEARLQQMREQMRDHLAAESAEPKEARLQQMRDRLADESAEQREARLQHIREQMRGRLGAESAEQRGQATYST